MNARVSFASAQARYDSMTPEDVYGPDRDPAPVTDEHIAQATAELHEKIMERAGEIADDEADKAIERSRDEARYSNYED